MHSDTPAHDGSDLVRRIGERVFDFDRQVAVMAIVNRTRDSFYDRGRTFALDRAVDAARSALDQGADWIDIGAVPFSPRTEPVDAAEERARVVPLVQEVRRHSDAVISVDTFRADVAAAAVAAGATAINDTSGLRDPEIADVAAESGAALIVTHSLAAPRQEWFQPTYEDVVDEVKAFLLSRAQLAVDRGVRPEQIIIDPGHDLNKNTVHSLELTRRLGELAGHGFPLLASVSNKDFIAEALGLDKQQLLAGTTATLTVCM
ncbi:MAG TPA: dihydropteroate synthase, partial [Actinomycetales bacterium]|nr:dihydropteroate synthase [Actinomycetales bacterium]